MLFIGNIKRDIPDHRMHVNDPAGLGQKGIVIPQKSALLNWVGRGMTADLMAQDRLR